MQTMPSLYNVSSLRLSLSPKVLLTQENRSTHTHTHTHIEQRHVDSLGRETLCALRAQVERCPSPHPMTACAGVDCVNQPLIEPRPDLHRTDIVIVTRQR